MCIQHPIEVKGKGNGRIGQVAYKGNTVYIFSQLQSLFPALHVLFLSTVSILQLFIDTTCICIYFASVLSHLVTMDLSRFVQVEYSLINNEHKLDTLTITT